MSCRCSSLSAAASPPRAISRKLGLSEAAIKTLLTNTYTKTGSQNRVQAARYYVRHYAARPNRPAARTATSHRAEHRVDAGDRSVGRVRESSYL